MCGSSSVEDSGLWTEEIDEELESISLMDDDLIGSIALGAYVGPFTGAPPWWGRGHFVM